MTADQPGTGGDFELPGMWGSADLKGGWADSGSASEERLRAEVQAGRDDLHQLHQEAQRALAALQSQRDALARENAEVAFRAISYRAWLATWTGPAAAHAAAILAAFRP